MLSSLAEKIFKLKRHRTDFKTELFAGLTTFMTMAYILAVNPVILGATGMPLPALFTATALAAAFASFLMAFLANLPFALAPGMGLNAFFAYTVVLGMGYSWQTALTAILIEGFLFLLLTILNVREAIANSIPLSIKRAISVGIGLFIAFIGLQNSGIIVGNPGTLVALGNVASPSVILTFLGITVVAVLLIYNVKGALLAGVLMSTIIGIPMGLTNVNFSGSFLPPSIAPIAFQIRFDEILSIDMIIIVFTFLFVDMFDTVGTFVGVATRSNMLDENGSVPKIKQAFLADSIGTIFGSLVGTSTVTTFVESASGCAEGGRTGLTSFVVGLLFILSLFLSPIFLAIPPAATAPALLMVGLFMSAPIREINYSDYAESVPAFICMLFMPFTYSIADGIVFSVLAFVGIKILSGRVKDVGVFTWVLASLLFMKLLIPHLRALL